MSKAILVMDMPNSCAKCKFVEHEDEGWLTCSLCDYRMAYVFERADYCPLRELPQKPDYPPINEQSYVAGWNACIDEIMKGSEENG